MKQHNESFASRLDGIETQWSLFKRAHEDSDANPDSDAANEARQALVLRYSQAIRNYVLAMTRDDEDAHEIAQDVVVRLLKGDFAGADPQRGRFRDLLKVAVRNMVRNHWAKQNRRRSADFDVDQIEAGVNDDVDDGWLKTWRDNVLVWAWFRLREYQTENPNSLAYTALKLRADNKELDSKQLADKLSTTTGRTVQPDAFRQQLRRARIRFAEMLVEEIVQGIDSADPTRVQEELICLGMYEQIKDVLPKEWRGA